MKVSLKTMLPVVALSLAALTSCDYSRRRAQNYCDSHGKTQEEYESLVYLPNSDAILGGLTTQSKLDSMAYRDIFNTTKAAQDSEAVAEFNKLASKFRLNYTSGYEKNLKEEKISSKDYSEVLNSRLSTVEQQHKVDKWVYKNFFKKIGIMTPQLEQKIERVEDELI